MNDFTPWFDPKEYSEFLLESSILFEVNVPLQKQKFENKKKLLQFDSQTARKRANLKGELMRDAAQAKAKGIQMGMGESFRNKLTNSFIENLIEDKTPIKAEKNKMRPEVDPADRERDRKRESRKQDKMTGLGNVLIVKHRGLNRVEIIEKGDFDPRSHELIKGKTKNADKGRVTTHDLQKVSQRSDFRNTKTSIRILGKVQNDLEKEAQQNEPTEDNSKNDNNAVMQQTPPPPPPPKPRVPDDGKEITDISSTYPDWDHSIQQMSMMMPEILNTLSGNEMSGEAQQMLSDSRTLGDAITRFASGFVETFPAATSMQYEMLSEPVPTGKAWQKKDVTESTGTAVFIGKGEGETVGFNVKIGKQLRLGEARDTSFIFDTVFSKANEQDTKDFSFFYKDLVDELRKTMANRTMYMPMNSTGEKTSTTELMLKKLKQEEAVGRRKQIVDKFRNILEVFINQNEAIKLGYIAEALTGNNKFDGGLGSAQKLVTSNKDGTDAKVIPLTDDYFLSLAKSKETRLSLKFGQGKITKSSPIANILQNVSEINESTQDAIAVLDNIKSEVESDPKNFMKLLGIEIIDVIFEEPVNLGDYYFEDTDTYNTIIFNPNSSKEEIVTIPVRTNYTPDGKAQNHLEKGIDELTDELTETYLLINDYLVEQIKQNNISQLDALIILEEQFNLEEKRNYRKEYDNYQGKPEQRANRSKRVLARRKLEKEGRVHKGDGKDVDHKNGNPQDNSDDNLRVLSKSKNRSMNEDHGAGFEGTSKLLRKYLKDTPYSGDPVPSSDVKYCEDGNQTPRKPSPTPGKTDVIRVTGINTGGTKTAS